MGYYDKKRQLWIGAEQFEKDCDEAYNQGWLMDEQRKQLMLDQINNSPEQLDWEADEEDE